MFGCGDWAGHDFGGDRTAAVDIGTVTVRVIVRVLLRTVDLLHQLVVLYILLLKLLLLGYLLLKLFNLLFLLF